MEKDVLLVVVGAGASYACVGEGERALRIEGLPSIQPADARPPLTQGLVGPGLLQDQILARYPAAKPLVAELRDVLGEQGTQVTVPFEELLAEYEKTTELDPVRRRHLMALRFYLRDLLWACTDYSSSPDMGSGITKYHRLVNELYYWARTHERHVCFVVFNYDLILENACHDVFGFLRSDFKAHVQDPYVSLVKPHGSVDWAWSLPGGSTFSKRAHADGTVITEASSMIEIDSNTLSVVQVAPHAEWLGLTHTRQVPALALPVAGKSEFVWPETQSSFFCNELQASVRGVLTLGWRGMEPHFLDLLPPLVRPGSQACLVTGGNAAVQDARDLQARLWNKLREAVTDFQHDLDGLPTSLKHHLDWLEPGFM